MIDTFLAKVTYVAPAAYDAQGHLRTEATIKMDVYDQAGASRSLTLTNGEDAYPYAVGDYVLLNAFTNAANSATESGVIKTGDDKYGEIVSKATSVDGAQSVIYYNAKQHNVEGTVYDDAVKFILDEADNSTENHTWFLDQYGNLIGAADIAATNSYGVINRIWWVGNAADGSGVAKANVTYVDGTTALVDISEMTYKDASSVLKTGTVSHSTATSSVMTADGTYFYVDSYINTNTNNDGNKLLNGHLFRFTTKSNGTLKAVEVDNYVAADNVADSGKLHNLANVAVSKNTQVYGGATGALVVNSNTVFLVRSGAGTTANPYTFKSIVGFTNIDTATGRGNANTIYSVALSNGYLDKDYTSTWVYTSTDPIRAASVNGVTYPLAAAYMNRNDVKVLTIQGSSSDTFEGNVYTHNDAKYSVVSNADFASKINSEFTNLGDKVIYLAYISGSGEYSGSILHANIVDRATTADELREISAVKPNGTVTAASSQSFKDITISNWDVTYTDCLTSGSTATVKTVNIEWYKLNEAGTEYNVKVVDTNAPFIAGNSYKFVATVELTGSNADDFTFADGANVYTGYVNNVQ